MINPFKKNDVELMQLKEAETQVKANLSELQRIANDLLLDTRYKKFADIFKDAEKNTIDLLFRYKESDPYKYKAKVDEFLVELRVYRNILNSVRDLNIGQRVNTPEFSQKFKKDMEEFIEKL